MECDKSHKSKITRFIRRRLESLLRSLLIMKSDNTEIKHLVLVDAIPDLEKEFCEILLREWPPIDAYTFTHRNEMGRRVKPWRKLSQKKKCLVGSGSPVFH
jgi:hypothetical protein